MENGPKKRLRSSTRLGKHVRHNLPAYLAIAVALSVTPAIAGHLNVQTSDIANQAVTKAKIDNKAVSPGKLTNLPKRVMVGKAGGPDFSTGGQGDCIWQPANAVIPGLGRPNFFEDHMGIIHLSGVAQVVDGLGGDGDCDPALDGEEEDGIVFRLPTKYRPEFHEIHGIQDIIILVVADKELVSQGVTYPPGAVIVGGSSTTVAALDGITFRPGSSTTATTAVQASPRRGSGEMLRELLGRN